MFNYSTRRHLWAFILGCLSFLALFAVFNLEPFQRRYFLTGDMFHQYYIFHSWLGETLRTGQFENLLYDWNAGLGNTMIGTVMYYLSSPFNLLTLFFNEKTMPLGMTFILMLKIGSITTAFYWFLTKLTGKHLLCSYVFALCYAFSGFTMTYLMNLMWLDQLITLPILFWYTLEWIHHRRWVPLFITLVISFFVNFYTAYMVGVFLVFITLIEFFKNHSRKDWKQALSLLIRLAGMATLAFCLLGVFFVPTLIQLVSGANSPFSFEVETLYSPLDLLSTLEIGFYDGVRTRHLPPLYVGLLSLIYTFSFFFQPKIPKKERILHGCFYFFLFLSFSINPLYNFWHGFKSPIWFSGRHAFIFSFYSLYLAFRGFQLNHPDGVRMGLLSVCTILFVSTIRIFPSLTSIDHLFTDHLSLILSWVFLLFYALFIHLIFHPKKLANLRCLLYLFILEVTIGAGLTLSGFIHDLVLLGTETFDSYLEERQELLNELETIEQEKSSKSLFNRYNLGDMVVNDGLLFHYPTIYSFNTLNNPNNIITLNHLAYMSNPAGSAFYHGNFYPILNSLLGVSYHYETNHLPEFYEPTTSEYLYFNPAALPLGFKADYDLLDIQLSDYFGLVAQDLILNSLIGQLDNPTQFSYELENNIYGSDNLEWNEERGIYELIDSTQPGSIEYRAYPVTDTPIYLIYNIPLQNQEELTIKLNGELLTDVAAINFETFSSTEISLSYTCHANSDCGIAPPIFFQIDESATQAALSKLQESPLVLTEHNNRFFSGMITMDEAGLLFTSVPYSTGWSAKVNGERVDTYPLLQASFLGLELPEGTHTIEFSYTPPGLKTGLVLTMLAFNGLLLTRAFILLRNELYHSQP